MNLQTTSVAPGPAMSERKVGLICALLVAIGPISMAVYTPAMTELVTAFATTESLIKLTLSSYFAGFAIAQLFCGPLSDTASSSGTCPSPMTFSMSSGLPESSA